MNGILQRLATVLLFPALVLFTIVGNVLSWPIAIALALVALFFGVVILWILNG